MPESSSGMKRLSISGFGEGNVVKRQRNDANGKPRSSDGRPPPAAKAIASGPDSGFRAKPVSLPAGGQRPPRPPALPSDPDEVLAGFKKSRRAPASAARLPLFPPRLADSPFQEPQKRVESKLETPSVNRAKQSNDLVSPFRTFAQPPNLRVEASSPTTPVRKVIPFLALPVSVSIPDEAPAESSTTPPKRPPLPKFDLGKEKKGKMAAMTTLELPKVDLPEEEVTGEILELQRGLLVSPEKGDRRRGRFVRNGLAERAQVLMNRSSTALILWRKEMESAAQRPGRLVPDLRLRVKEIVHVSRNANVQSRASGALRAVLATCTLPDGDERSVLLSFSNEEHGFHSSPSASPPALGSEILVWRPWQETKDPPMLFCPRFLVLSDAS